jgi:hypothetical protein
VRIASTTTAVAKAARTTAGVAVSTMRHDWLFTIAWCVVIVAGGLAVLGLGYALAEVFL